MNFTRCVHSIPHFQILRIAAANCVSSKRIANDSSFRRERHIAKIVVYLLRKIIKICSLTNFIIFQFYNIKQQTRDYRWTVRVHVSRNRVLSNYSSRTKGIRSNAKYVSIVQKRAAFDGFLFETFSLDNAFTRGKKFNNAYKYITYTIMNSYVYLNTLLKFLLYAIV